MRYTEQVLGLLFFITSCSATEEREKLSVYFGMEDLFTQQISILNDLQPRMFKKVVLDDKTEQMEIQPDSSQWAAEFEIFLESDINKPSLVGAFDENVSENKIVYSRKDQSSDGVKEIEVLYYSGTKIPLEIKINSSTKNSLYTSSRQLTVTFQNKRNAPLLSSYSITGNQTILSGKATTYQVKVELRFND